MWVPPPLPVYSTLRDPTRRAGKDAATKAPSSNVLSTSAVPLSNKHKKAPSSPPTSPPTSPLAHHHTTSITNMLEPAIDGPPSPESIRQFSKQMKQISSSSSSSSAMDKHLSQQTTSSGSSSLRSHASWDQSLDNGMLSRRSSGVSASGNLPLRERPESVQLFGKSIFSRRGKLKRESSGQSSSGSSFYSTDGSFDASASKEHFLPHLFHRRRATRFDTLEEESSAQRKLQISGPYNFQHVTHTRKESLPNLPRASRAELSSDFTAWRSAQMPSRGALQGISAESLRFPDLPEDAPPIAEEPSEAQRPEIPPRLNPGRLNPKKKRAAPPTLANRPLITRTQSEELLSVPPRRPPRSPIEPSSTPLPILPPVPPPRKSSRASSRGSIRFDAIDALSAASLDRPQTSSGGFRPPQPFSPVSDVTSSPPSIRERSESPELQGLTAPRFSHAITTSDDAAWPLTTSTLPFDTGLPDVPEEDEHHHVLMRGNRTSLASVSSLRGSHSVPLLRQILQNQPPRVHRPSSGTSDTLGRFDLSAAQRSPRSALHETDGAESLPRENWEDDIDYCYEHEVEAHCDYAWERPSLDICREEEVPCDCETADGATLRSAAGSPFMLARGRPDVPRLSPASQASNASSQEAPTPTILANPVRSNFSLPRASGLARPHHLQHMRTASGASSFKESQGFHFSPSLLIPGDFHHEMLLAQQGNEGQGVTGHEQLCNASADDMESSLLFNTNRSSASTTGSQSDTRSILDRHISTMSTSTAFTRLTNSVDMTDCWHMPKSEPLLQGPFAGAKEPKATEASEVGVLRRDRNRGSDPNLLRKFGESKGKDKIVTRPRARTTSSAAPTYGLFPATSLSISRV